MAEFEATLLAEMLRESIKQGTTPSLAVTSNSMSPLLRSGDHVGLQELVPSKAQPGQIITFSNTGQDDLITHRIAGIVLENGEAKIATLGDRTLLFDVPVAPEDVVGQVIWRRRNGRTLNLMSGRGAWLSGKLEYQAREELRRATGLRLGNNELDSESINRSNGMCRRYRKNLGARILWRINYLWASMLAITAEYLPNSGETEDYASQS